MIVRVNNYLRNLLLVFVAIGSLIIFSKPTYAKTGIGFIVGSPTALSVKINNFPVIQVGYSLLDSNPYFSAAVDYWFFNPSLGSNFKFFLGVGAGVTFSDNVGVGIRVPVGLQWLPSSLIEVFVQTVPTLNVIPATTFGNDWGVGIRFYFL